VAQLRHVKRLGALSVTDWLQGPDIVVLAVAPEASRDFVGLTREIRAQSPRAAIVAYCGGIRDTPASLGGLAAAGVHQFLFEGINDRGSMLRAILDSARHQCVAEIVMSEMRTLVAPAMHPMVEAALTRPSVVTDVSALAKALGVHRKTLFNRCARAGSVLPQELLTWSRLALVAYLLEWTGCTVEELSIELGYASATALRNTIKRHVGLRATEIRSRGGLKAVLDRLRDRLSALSLHAEATLTRPAELHTV
jgi:AraC-like DNA-binding protein